MKNVGVIITTFNNANTIIKSVESVVSFINSNPKTKIEILVVDDASTDETVQIITTHAQRLKIDKIHVFDENAGVSRSRNFGINYFMKMNFITFVDGDDEIIDITFNEQLEVLSREDLIIFDYMDCSPTKQFYCVPNLSKTGSLSKKFLLRYLQDYAKKPNRHRLFTMCWGKLFSTEIFKIHHELRFNENLQVYEDLDFVLRYLRKCNNVYYIKQSIYIYNLPDFNFSKNNATFGNYWRLYQLFSFFYALRQLRFLYSELGLNKFHADKLIKHCCGAYVCIATIRSFVRVRTIKDFFYVSKVIRFILDKPTVKKSLQRYDPKVAAGNKLLTLLLKRNLVMLASSFSLYISFQRYRRKNFQR
jgi:succinoglycan biosynthesis protein ExoO